MVLQEHIKCLPQKLPQKATLSWFFGGFIVVVLIGSFVGVAFVWSFLLVSLFLCLLEVLSL